MRQKAYRVLGFVVLGFGVLLSAQTPAVRTALSDAEFWRLVTSLSEQTGEFPIGNLVSNERDYPDNVARINRTGGAYIGVGPEQNFSFIAALQPDIAFIVDLRRGNRTLHLLYKAVFEMAPDRAAFMALLFPAGEPAYQANERMLLEHLTRTHGFALSDAEIGELKATYQQFFAWGPRIGYTGTMNALGQPIAQPQAGNSTPFAELIALADSGGLMRSFMASEQRYQWLRNAHRSNLIVPLVGNFAGGETLRGIGAYLKDGGISLSVFYGSNVQDYLTPEQRRTYCANLNALPFDDATHFLSYPVRRSTTLAMFASTCPGSR